ncbi:PREDICTED: uncharacterized protein LOC107353953 isoform X3 [Acropora digitifera]|uniref:uncharacterized protein LOC107353953 isoform X3 n=1 Tax=Acropora digitifera TaxID=70779 RepID=UPI00077B214A|nr:PREDICTED: uncharacterized protein LOC107353953 isoform X3 [Acropora digitifera]
MIAKTLQQPFKLWMPMLHSMVELFRSDSGISGCGQESREEKFPHTKVNMNISSVMDYLLSLFKLESQSIFGGVRFLLTLVMFPTLLAKLDTGSGRLGFSCSSKADDGITRQCFSKYSADMSSFFYPNTFAWMTAVILFVLWSSIILYSSKHLKKIRRKMDLSEKKQLCHELWKKSLLHVCCEALVIILILIFFHCTQEISLPETYNCSVWNASKEIIQTCEDVHHWDKSKLNCYYVFMMASLVVLCIATIFDTMYNKECYLKELLDLNTNENEVDDDSNYHRNTPRSANDGSDGFTNPNNHNEQPGRHKRSNIDAAQVPDEICQDLADEISKDWKKLGRRLSISAAALDNIDHENPSVWEKSIAMLNKWRENCGEEAIMKVLTEALKKIRRKDLSEKVEDKMLALAKKQLLPTEGGLASWNTGTGLCKFELFSKVMRF